MSEATPRLPVFSTKTYDEARMLRTLHCRLARDGSGMYFLNNPPERVEDLDGVTDMLRASYGRVAAA